MNLPELPPADMGDYADNLSFSHDHMHEYGAACYAKAIQDYIKRVGEPIGIVLENEPLARVVVGLYSAKELPLGMKLHFLPKD
jgi:hypothetical protein